VPYFQQVEPRFTTWFLAALLTLATSLAVPISSVVVTPTYGISRSDGVRREQQKVSERRERTPLLPSRTSPRIPAYDLSGPILILDQSLFQRPPPSALLFSV
jgi:hypothetical protein